MRITLDLQAEEWRHLLAALERAHGASYGVGREVFYKVQRAELAAQLGRCADSEVGHVGNAPNWPDGVEPAQVSAKRTCNRHVDCDAADEVAKANHGTFAAHCRDDCFGN